MDNNALVGETDARVWTKHWLETLAEHPHIATDEDTMIGWFANAIESGRSAGSDSALREIHVMLTS